MSDCVLNSACAAALMRDIVEDCENRIHSGQGNVAILINYNDIANVVRDASNRRIITDIVLASGAKAYRLENIRNNPFTGSNTAVEVGDFRNTYTRTVAFFVPLDGWETSKEILDPIKDGKFVLIISNDWQHINSVGVVDNKYQVYGIDKGLFVSSMQQTRYENSDVWSIEMTETEVNNSGLWLQHYGAWNTSPVLPVPFQFLKNPDGTHTWILSPLGIVVSPAEFVQGYDEEQNIVYIYTFGYDNVLYRLLCNTDPNEWPCWDDSTDECAELTGRFEAATDDTCEFLNGLTEEEDKPVEP